MSIKFEEKVLNKIRDVIGDIKVSLHEPIFEGNEIKYLKECIDTSYVSSIGPFVKKLERKLSCFTGARYTVATVNGTCALQLALIVSGVKKEEEVLIPSLTFVATANAVIHIGAVPNFLYFE